MFFLQTEPTPIIIQYPTYLGELGSLRRTLKCNWRRLSHRRRIAFSDLSDEGIIFLHRKVDFEGEHHIYTKVIFFLGVSASSTGELELSDFVAHGAHGSALNEPGAERWRKVAAQPGGRLQMQLGQAASPGWRFSSTEAKQDFVQRGTKNREK